MLNPRDGLEERDDIFSFFSFSNNVILLNITNTSYNYIKLINTTLSLMIPMGGVKFSWPVARENLIEGSLSHGSQFLTEQRIMRVLKFPSTREPKSRHLSGCSQAFSTIYNYN